MPDMKDRKGKKNNKKQAMSEPVDLEAGNYVPEPEVPTVAKAIYDNLPDNKAAEMRSAAEVTKQSTAPPLDGDTVTETLTPAASKGPPKTLDAPVPPPPKAKTRVPSTEVATEAPQDEDSEVKSADIAVSEATEGETSKASKQEEPTKDVEDVTKVHIPHHDPTKTEVAGSTALNDFLQGGHAQKVKDPVVAGSPAADITKNTAREKLQLAPLVSGRSITPKPPKVNTAAEAKTMKDRPKQHLTLVPLVSAWSFFPEPSRAPTAIKEAQPDTSSKKHQQKAAKSHNLHFLPPFDHKAFSRFDNLPRPTTK